MSEPYVASAPAGRGSLVGMIERVGRAAARDVVRLGELAATVQQHRYESGASPHRETTRSTALWSALQVDPSLAAALEDSGVSAARLGRVLELRASRFPAASTTRIHDDFAAAMEAYLRDRRDVGPVTLAEVVLAILLSVRDSPSRGVLAERLPAVDGAILQVQRLIGALPPEPSGSEPPDFDPGAFSVSVREVRGRLASQSVVTPGQIAESLRAGEGHRGYAGGRFTAATFDPTGTQAPVDQWCRRVLDLYGVEGAGRDGQSVIDGRRLLLGLAALDADFRAQLERDDLLEALRDEVGGWVPVQPTPAAELEGGLAREHVDSTRGIDLSEDRLGVATYVSMLATVVCDPATPMPLSVGIFGEWGTGKSFFMGLMRGQIEAITGREGDRYLHDIRQISFNAWHYADTNLWASLGDEIFRQLLYGKDEHQGRQARLREEIGALNTQRRELGAVVEHAEDEAARLRVEIERASSERAHSARDLLVAIQRSDTFQDRLRQIWRRLGIHDPVEQARLLASEVRGTADEATVIRRSLADRRGLVYAALAVTALLLVVGVALRPGSSLESVVQALTAALGTLLAAAVAVATATRRGLSRLRQLMDELRTGVDQHATERVAAELAEPFEALLGAETRRDVAQARLDSLEAQVAELGRELAELAPGQRLYSFLAERVEAGDYSRNLGLISTIRKDFERLIDLMAQWREERAATVDQQPGQPGQPGQEVPPPDPAKRPIDRIVLYIDDLDRCSSRQVVEVLQAVHLLMALDLFVVVVGVDPRWLLRSLQEQYPRLLEPSRRGDADGTDGSWDATPEDYLEKIFGIPLILPGMATGTLDGILRGIMRVEPDPGDEAATDPSTSDPADGTTSRHGTSGRADDTRIEAEHSSQVDAVQHALTTPAPALLPLSRGEITLLGSLEPLVGTPREAKRLANVYRMIRATRDLSPASRFRGDDGRPGEYEAVVLLLGLLTAHARLLGAVLDSPADPAQGRPGGLMRRSSRETWSQLVAGMQPQRHDGAWSNAYVATMTAPEQEAWRALWTGLEPATRLVTLPDLTALQAWAPRIRRFSFVIPPSSSGSRPG